jgi:hypothetical protein
MRVRLTVRYRTFGRTVRQVLFMVRSHIRDPSNTAAGFAIELVLIGCATGPYLDGVFVSGWQLPRE